MRRNFVFSSESVTEGHPDKLCDRISDALVGHYLQRDPLARVVAECAISTGILFVAVKAASTGAVDVPFVARDVIRAVGYQQDGFNARDCTVMTSIADTDPAMASPVDEDGLDEGELESVPARDQVTLFGFACTHTAALVPLPIWLAHKLARGVAAARRDRVLPYLLPDGKTQVAVEFRDRKPARIHGITVVTSHRPDATPPPERVRADVIGAIVAPAFGDEPIAPDDNTRIEVNPEGLVIGGGPAVHSGLTGRKTAVDTYGEYARHSGAALSGKDPSRIDRSGAYAARHAAKNVVAAGLATECEVQLSYAIGHPRPVSVVVETFGTHTVDEQAVEDRVARVFDFRPAAIVRRFGLRRLPAMHSAGFYVDLAAYGQVGRADLELPWERVDMVEALRS
jgi:S-adenosylmethionine synthetase